MTAGPAPGRAADRVTTIFFGSGGFAVPILDALVAEPPDRAGRGRQRRPIDLPAASRMLTPTPVALRARALGLPLLQPAHVRAAERWPASPRWRPSSACLPTTARSFRARLLDLPERGILNVHPSMLPRHRGATPIAATIAEGDNGSA